MEDEDTTPPPAPDAESSACAVASSSNQQNMKTKKMKKSPQQESQQQQPSSLSESKNNNNKPTDPEEIVPQLVNHNITFGELETCVKVLEAVASLKPTKKKKKNNNNNKKRKLDQTTQTTEEDNNGDNNNNNNNGEGDDEEKKNLQQLLEQYKHTNLRPIRKALSKCLELHQITMYEGKTQIQFLQEQQELRTLKRQKCSERDLQRNYINATTLRKGRVEKLQQKTDDAKDEEELKLKQVAMITLMIPDGHVETTNTNTTNTNTHGNNKLLLTNDTTTDTTLEGGGQDSCNNNNNKQQQQQQQDQDSNMNGGDKNEKRKAVDVINEPIQLPLMRSCYVCKTRYRQLHHFYDQLCPNCANLNWLKRHQSCNLKGKVAVITGSRVKIGYQTCLKLLRAGCTVIATTRFPNQACCNFRNEIDFNKWKNQLHVYGLDLRDVTGIEAFCRYLKIQFGGSTTGIDILINNACQTIRRPTQYYLPSVQKEQAIWENSDTIHRNLLKGCIGFEKIRHQLLLDHKNQGGTGGSSSSFATDPPTTAIIGVDSSKTNNNNQRLLTEEEEIKQPAAANAVVTVDESDDKKQHAIVATTTTSITSNTSTPFENTGMSHSAAMSQTILLPEDVGISDDVLPSGITDINGQQLDLRKTNSWLLKMEEVTTPEIMECMFINAIAPFVLNSRLKPLMCTPSTSNRPDRYIINVSAMEGKFYRYKMANHPHTNMAKAALNMMTRTSAEDLATKHRIYMNSVDTGWINDENPLEKASKTAKNNNFQTPIDEIDAAARILDPIFTGCMMDIENNDIENDDSKSSSSGGEKKKKKKKKKPTTKTTKKDYGKFLKDYHETEW